MQFTPEVQAALQTLKNAAENDFERHRIAVLERDLTEPPKVEIIDDTHQKFNGVIFHQSQRKNDGHFNGHVSVHRAIYSYYFGEISSNFLIHHIDFNPANNDISNLQLVTYSEHRAIHNANVNEKFVCEVCGKTYMTKRPFHKARFCSKKCSNEFFHHKLTKICQNCSKEFTTSDPDAKFCSSKCYGQTLRKAPLEKKCIVCGKTFYASAKHPEKRACSQECRIILRKMTLEKNLKFISDSVPVSLPPSDVLPSDSPTVPND